MSDFPAKVNTETSSPSQGGHVAGLQSFASRYVSVDLEFIRTIPSILILVEITLGLLVWALISSTSYTLVPAYGWVMFVSVLLWILTIALFIILFFRIHQKFFLIPWLMVVLIFAGVATLLYLTAFLASAVSVSTFRNTSDFNNLAASAFFAVIVTITYGASTFFAFLAWRGDGGSATNITIPA